MVTKGKQCSWIDQHYIAVPLTAMTQLKDAGHVRKRKQGETSAGQQLSGEIALPDFWHNGQK